MDSLLESEDKAEIEFNIILVESNKDAKYRYPETQIIYPNEIFGYNRFLNIGLQYVKGDYHAFCNNDLIFHKNWISNIIEYNNLNPKVLSFSPIDLKYPSMGKIASGAKPNWGYVPKYHIAGWCIVVKKEIFQEIDCIFDPIFDFYYADDDYGLTLLKNNIPHRLVINSKVEHLASQTETIRFGNPSILNLLDEQGLKYPKYLEKDSFNVINSNYNLLLGYLKMYKKWGGYYSLSFKYIMFKRLPFIRLKLITKLIYSMKFNF